MLPAIISVALVTSCSSCQPEAQITFETPVITRIDNATIMVDVAATGWTNQREEDVFSWLWTGEGPSWLLVEASGPQVPELEGPGCGSSGSYQECVFTFRDITQGPHVATVHFHAKIQARREYGGGTHAYDDISVDLDFHPAGWSPAPPTSAPPVPSPTPVAPTATATADPYGHCATGSFEVDFDSPLYLADVGWAELVITITGDPPGATSIELTGDPALLAVAEVTTSELAPGKWSLIIDHGAGTAYPVGTHETLVDVAVGGASCQAPLIVDVYRYVPER